MEFAKLLSTARRQTHSLVGKLLPTEYPVQYAEIGIHRGCGVMVAIDTAMAGSTLHLFDFAKKFTLANRMPYDEFALFKGIKLIKHKVSEKRLDSYNWDLMWLLDENKDRFLDYVYIDGSHTWCHDALAFLLVDRMLRPGACVEFDDYGWVPRQNKVSRNPKWQEGYTDEQMNTAQVKKVVDLLVKRDQSYEEVVPNQAYRKRIVEYVNG